MSLETINKNYQVIDEKIDAVNTSIRELTGEFDKLREKTAEAERIVAQTDSIIKYIQNVATQMTLLGFNASIEAKRAGAAGAGFNVPTNKVTILDAKGNIYNSDLKSKYEVALDISEKILNL